MGREVQEKEIDGIRFTVRPLSGMRGVTFLPRLNKVLGPAIAALAAGRGVLDFPALKEALEALGDKLTEEEMASITRTLLDGCTYMPTDGKPGGELLRDFDIVMMGRAETVYKLLWFALEVNYSGFFPVLASLSLKPPQEGSGLPLAMKMPPVGHVGA